jgi:hypothetical protein
MSRHSHLLRRKSRQTHLTRRGVAFPGSQLSFAVVTGSASCTSRYSATSSASVSDAARPARPSRSSTFARARRASAPSASAPEHCQRPTGDSGSRVSGAKPGSAAPIGPIARKRQ